MTEPKADNAGVITHPPFIYLGFLAAGFALDAGWPLGIGGGAVGLALGLGAIAAGVAVVPAVLFRFRRAGTPIDTHKPTTAVVTDGLHAVSRNPVYLGLALIYAGIAVAADNVWALSLLAPLLVVMRYGVIGREERYLEAKFGDEYHRYKARVRRWL